MRLTNNLGLKIYTVIFAAYAGSSLISLEHPEGTTGMYYKTLATLHHPSMFWYIMALVNAVFTCAAVIPLFDRSFNRPGNAIKFFQYLFFIRLATALLGHNYELVTIKSAFLSAPLVGIASLGIWLLFMFPSFKEHAVYAFSTQK